jgi:phage gpG-like protein
MLGRSVLGGGLVLLLTVSTALAQPGGSPGGFPGGGPRLFQPGQVVSEFFQDQLKLTAEQKTAVESLQKDVDTKLDKLFTDAQKKQWKEMKDNPGRGFGGPGGPGGRGPAAPPKVGQILSDAVQEQLKLTDEQKKEVVEVQKVADAKLDQLFTDAQKKQWKDLKDNPFRGFGGPGAPLKLGQIMSDFTQDQLKLTDEQKKEVVELQKVVDTKLDQLFADEQRKQWKEMRDNPFRGFGGPGGPGGPGGRGPAAPPKVGQIMSDPVQEQLKLTDEQKKEVVELQKVVDTNLDKLFADEQKKQWKDIKDNAGRGFGGPGGFGFGGPVRLEDVKKQLDATDEEWKVISPKLQKVINTRQILTSDARGATFGGGFGGPGTNIVSQAQADLKAVLDDPKHSKAEVEEKIAAVRKARQKARADLEAAQKDLLQMLTASQEAVLISLGYLE